MKPHATPFRPPPHDTTCKGSRQIGGFTLFEVLIALGVFMIAVTGLVIAIDTGLQVVIQARQHATSRELLESRLALCQVDPPPEGSPRVIEARENHGVRVEESLAPFPAKDAKGTEIAGLKKLTIITKAPDQTDRAEILMYQQ
jgi:Prokaryotic N-terminal methylation motif